MRARLFVAVFPPDEVVSALEKLPRPDAPGVRWEPPDRWHVTLRFLGPADPAAVVAALGSTALPVAAAALGPEVELLGDSVVVVPVGGLDAVADVVLSATSGLGRPPEARPYVGHLTLARLQRGTTAAIVGSAVHGEFDVSEVCMVESHPAPDGPRYEVLARVPCQPQKDPKISGGPVDRAGPRS